jgi:hypothetical protein
VIDPRTTNIVGASVRLVRRWDRVDVGRGIVRVVDYAQGSFTLLIEARGDAYEFGACDRGLFQVALADESTEVVIEGETSPSPSLPRREWDGDDNFR